MPDPTDKTQTILLDADELRFLKEVLCALGELPGVWVRVEAYMIGCGVKAPHDVLARLGKTLFKDEEG